MENLNVSDDAKTPGPGASEGILTQTTTIYDYQESTESSTLGNGMVIPHSELGPWSTGPFIWSRYLIFQTITAVIGIIGNGLVMLVLFQRRAKRRSTDTLVGGLATADFLTSIFILPVPKAATVPVNWLGELYCMIQETKITKDICVTASIYLLVAISFERYIAIGHPIYFNRFLTRGRVAASIVIIWFFAILTSVPRIFTITVRSVDNRGTLGVCFYKPVGRTNQITLSLYLFCLRIFIPTVTMLVTQSLIAKHLYRQGRRFRGKKDTSFHDVARRRVVKLMLIVIITYIICWGPSQVTVFLFLFGILPPSFRQSPAWIIIFMLSFFNSCANPIIYAIRFKEFREAVWALFSRQRRPLTAIFEQEKRNNNTDKPTRLTNVKTDGLNNTTIPAQSTNSAGIGGARNNANIREQ
ncbi:growth hormone secretagogue receptor type 1-like [Lytechinus variegatus]|uniref:growth hormone secretagogue receptor type 1-like n=1 Tax=Lytechinus variegatus TaxID=7654 RepID=UPI001BB221C7|nr:growth hormone secretagogue receptor type 1-like [Lytechinus variegatus]